jgi:hypothetical protein
MTSFYFDTREYTPEPSSFDPLPEGTYNGMIVKALEKVSQTSGNAYASLEIEIIDGQYKGRKVYDNLFLHSTNATAQNIARAKLNGIATSLDLAVINGEQDFLFKPLAVSVNIDKDGKNQVKKYLAKQSAIAPSAFANRQEQPVQDVPF